MIAINRKPRGFTLIEILLVMLITSILVLGVNTAFRQAHMLWARVEKQRPVYQKTRLLFNVLRQELSCLYLPKIEDQQEQQPAAFSLSAMPDGTVRLAFFTMNPAWKDTSFSNLPAKVIYDFSTDPDSGKKILTRTEQLFSGERPAAKEKKEIVLEGFSAAVVRAADPEIASLADSWKNELQCSQKPPKAVKMLLKWPKDEQSDFEFETIFKTAASGQLTPP